MVFHGRAIVKTKEQSVMYLCTSVRGIVYFLLFYSTVILQSSTNKILNCNAGHNVHRFINIPMSKNNVLCYFTVLSYCPVKW